MAGDTKVGIVVPSGDMVHSRFMVCLVSMIQCSMHNYIEPVILNPRSSLIATGRQMGVDMAEALNCEYIFWVDSDMVFPHDTLVRLLAQEEDVIGCTYVKRLHPTQFVHAEKNGEEPYLGTGVREVELLPTGLLLTKTEVFKDIPRPVWRCGYLDGKEIGEDYYFCLQMERRGISRWLHADVSAHVGHLGTYTFTHLDLPEEN